MSVLGLRPSEYELALVVLEFFEETGAVYLYTDGYDGGNFRRWLRRKKYYKYIDKWTTTVRALRELARLGFLEREYRRQGKWIKVGTGDAREYTSKVRFKPTPKLYRLKQLIEEAIVK